MKIKRKERKFDMNTKKLIMVSIVTIIVPLIAFFVFSIKIDREISKKLRNTDNRKACIPSTTRKISKMLSNLRKHFVKVE